MTDANRSESILWNRVCAHAVAYLNERVKIVRHIPASADGAEASGSFVTRREVSRGADSVRSGDDTRGPHRPYRILCAVELPACADGGVGNATQTAAAKIGGGIAAFQIDSYIVLQTVFKERVAGVLIVGSRQCS